MPPTTSNYTLLADWTRCDIGVATHPFLRLDVVLDRGPHRPCGPRPHLGVLVVQQVDQRLPETQGGDVVRIVDALDQRLEVLHGIALFLQAVVGRGGPFHHLLHRLSVGGWCRAAHQLLQHGRVELGFGRRGVGVVEGRIRVFDAPLEHVVDVGVVHVGECVAVQAECAEVWCEEGCAVL
jgi:hypothetical protein